MTGGGAELVGSIDVRYGGKRAFGGKEVGKKRFKRGGRARRWAWGVGDLWWQGRAGRCHYRRL